MRARIIYGTGHMLKSDGPDAPWFSSYWHSRQRGLSGRLPGLRYWYLLWVKP